MYSRENCLGNMDLWLEHDAAYGDLEADQELADLAANEKLVICGDIESRILDDCFYIYVDPDYQGALSPGQQKAYELLLTLQKAAIYVITTVGKLAIAQGLENPLACGKRLENLQSLGAISGYQR